MNRWCDIYQTQAKSSTFQSKAYKPKLKKKLITYYRCVVCVESFSVVLNRKIKKWHNWTCFFLLATARNSSWTFYWFIRIWRAFSCRIAPSRAIRIMKKIQSSSMLVSLYVQVIKARKGNGKKKKKITKSYLKCKFCAAKTKFWSYLLSRNSL